MPADYALELLAEDALLLRFGNRIDPGVNATVHAAARLLREARLPAVQDIAPAYASVLVRFDPHAWRAAPGAAAAPAGLLDALRTCLLPLQVATPDPDRTGGGCIEIPVCYGGAYGPDLEAVAAHAGIPPAEVVARHCAVEYTVAMLGFAPGFAYLLGLDPALEVPRHATPRTRVWAGSVAIGGAQTGIYPRDLPGGWNVLGRTPRTLFDPSRDPPCLLSPGQRLRFRAIDAAAFEAAVED